MKKTLITIAIFYWCIHNSVTASIIDQSFEPLSSISYAGIGAADFAQTFTVGVTGNLTSVEVLLEGVENNNDNLLFDIRRTIAGVPIEENSNTIFSDEILFSNIPTTRGFFSIDLTSKNLKVNEGETLAIVLRSEGYQLDGIVDYWWLGTSWHSWRPDEYIEGDGYARADFRNDLPYSGLESWGLPNLFSDDTRGPMDYGFRTYVTAVPEPPTLLLFMSGIVFLSFIRLRSSFLY